MNQNLIYDVGMHNGNDTAYYLHKGFNVVGIEADPILVKEVSKRFKKQINNGQLQILNMGIAESAGILDFWICESNSAWSSFDKNSAARLGSVHHSIKVHCTTFDTVLKKYGVPYYLKIDIEGNDIHCIESLSADNLPKYISIEADGTYNDLKKLKELGYTKFKCISQFYFLPVQSSPAIETKINKWLSMLNLPGRAMDKLIGKKLLSNRVIPTCWKDGWFFPMGSSGPFGEDTPGHWLDYDEIIHTYKYFKQLFDKKKSTPFWRNDKYRAFWADFHACRDN